MNSNTFLKRFGLNPNDFNAASAEPVTTDDGYLYLLEQDNSKIPCPACNSNHIVIKDYYYKDINCSESIHIKDIFRIKTPRFKCKDCNKTFTKPLSNIEENRSISNKTIQMICADFHVTKTFSEIADRYHVSTATVINIFDNDIATPNRLSLPEVLCIDEFYFSKDKDNKYCVVLVDWKTKKVIDILQNRKLPYLREYFSKIDSKELKKVKYFVSDLYDGYRTIHKEFFNKAHHIADFYHITVQLIRPINIIRTTVMKSLNVDSIEYKFMKKNWSYFLRRLEKVPESKIFKTRSGLEEPVFDIFMKCVKIDVVLWNGYDCLQDLFKFQKDRYYEDSVNDFKFLIKKLRKSQNKYLDDVANTYEKWLIEIGNAYSLHKGFKDISNSISECSNNQIKTIIKVAYGYQNFERFRKRVLLLLWD